MVAGFSLPTSPCTFAFSNSVQDFTLIFAQFSLSGAPEVILNPDSVSSDIYNISSVASLISLNSPGLEVLNVWDRIGLQTASDP